MPTTPDNVIGLERGKLLASKQNFYREADGLERVIEEFYFNTADRDEFALSLFSNFTPYAKAYNKTIQSAQSQNTISERIPLGDGHGYEYLVVERAEYENMDGGITLAKVTYVGLYTTSSPAPIIELVPAPERTYIHYRYYIRASFIKFMGEPGSVFEKTLIESQFGEESGGLFFPAPAINYQKLPIATIRRYVFNSRTWASAYGGKASLRWNRCNLSGLVPDGLIIEGQPNLIPADATITYYGFIITGFSVKRYGYFGLVNWELKEGARVDGFSADVGTSGSTNCTSTLNFSL